jgi:hypothetical protein
MDMMLIQDSPAYSEAVRVHCVWTVKERDPKSGFFIPVLQRKNIFTNYGLTALAAVPGGQPYTAPQYLAIENNGAAITNAGGISASATSCTAATDILEAGDTQLILGVGTANQETVTGASVSGTGPYTYSFAACTKSHANGDPICRVPLAGDTVATLQNEWQYDSTNAPNQRMGSAAGYTTGTGVWVTQWYYNGAQGLGNMTTIGMCDLVTVGGGNLHNHVALGYVHSSGSDVEIDGTLTLIN